MEFTMQVIIYNVWPNKCPGIFVAQVYIYIYMLPIVN